MIGSYCWSLLDDARNWFVLAGLVRKSKADCMHEIQTEQVCLLLIFRNKKESTTVERKWKSSSFSEGRNMYSRVRTNNVPNINGNTEV